MTWPSVACEELEERLDFRAFLKTNMVLTKRKDGDKKQIYNNRQPRGSQCNDIYQLSDDSTWKEEKCTAVNFDIYGYFFIIIQNILVYYNINIYHDVIHENWPKTCEVGLSCKQIEITKHMERSVAPSIELNW